MPYKFTELLWSFMLTDFHYTLFTMSPFYTLIS